MNRTSASNANQRIDFSILGDQSFGFVDRCLRSMLPNPRESACVSVAKNLFDLFDQRRLGNQRITGDDKGLCVARGE